jgi:hypothetical protein
MIVVWPDSVFLLSHLLPENSPGDGHSQKTRQEKEQMLKAKFDGGIHRARR